MRPNTHRASHALICAAIAGSLASILTLGACTPSPPTPSATPINHAAPTSTGSYADSSDPLGITGKFTAQASSSPDPINIDAQVQVQSVTGEKLKGFSRFIIHYTGKPAAPLQWSSTGWQDEVVYDGSGAPIELKGRRSLQIHVAGVAYPDDLNIGQDDVPLTMPPDPQILDAQVHLPFEGYHNFQIGADHDFPYRVTVLNDPVRLVLDVQTGEQ